MMSKWSVMILVGALLVLPSYAQKGVVTADGDSTTGELANRPPDAAANTTDTSHDVNVVPAHNFYALPRAPRATPFPGPKEAVTEEAPGRLLPRYERAMSYEYINFRPGEPYRDFNNHGAIGAFTI